MKHDKKVRSYIEALFLLTYKQEFVLNIRVDGKLDIDNLEMTSNPAFEFEDLREQELRDIVLNVSRLVKKGKIVPEAFSYCAGYIKKKAIVEESSGENDSITKDTKPSSSDIKRKQDILHLEYYLEDLIDSIFSIENQKSGIEYLPFKLARADRIKIYTVKETSFLEDEETFNPDSESARKDQTESTSTDQNSQKISQIVKPTKFQQQYELKTSTPEKANQRAKGLILFPNPTSTANPLPKHPSRLHPDQQPSQPHLPHHPPPPHHQPPAPKQQTGSFIDKLKTSLMRITAQGKKPHETAKPTQKPREYRQPDTTRGELKTSSSCRGFHTERAAGFKSQNHSPTLCLR